MNTLAIASLHKHFLAADALKVLMFVQIPEGSAAPKLGKDWSDAAQAFSSMLRIQVFYALMYVVLEGYKELDCKDPEIDELLANQPFVEAFRRFRNATFHFQRDPIPPKLVEFVTATGSEMWTKSLYHAFEAFFEKRLRLNEHLAALSQVLPAGNLQAAEGADGA